MYQFFYSRVNGRSAHATETLTELLDWCRVQGVTGVIITGPHPDDIQAIWILKGKKV